MLQQKVKDLRRAIDDVYRANELCTGMGSTMGEDGKLGGREVMMKPNGNGLKLTPDNHRRISLGVMTQSHFDALFPPPGTAPPGTAPPVPPMTDPSVTD